MKYFTSLLLVASFVGIAVFGFALIDHDMQSPNNDCVASALDGTECPMNIVAMTLHHVSAIQILTTTTVPSIGNWFLLLAFASLVFIGLSLFFHYQFNPPRLVFYRYRSKYSFYPPQKREYLRWLALHENSPATL